MRSNTLEGNRSPKLGFSLELHFLAAALGKYKRPKSALGSFQPWQLRTLQAQLEVLLSIRTRQFFPNRDPQNTTRIVLPKARKSHHEDLKDTPPCHSINSTCPTSPAKQLW